MNIGIIGTGQIGATLAKQYTTVGHRVKMTNSGALHKLKTLEKDIGAKAVALQGVTSDIDILAVAIPFVAIPPLSDSARLNLDSNTIIIDYTNYYPIREGKIEEIENGRSKVSGFRRIFHTLL